MSNPSEPTDDGSAGVLRPFEEPPSEPLPSVDPPDLVTDSEPVEPPTDTPSEIAPPGEVPVADLVADLDATPALSHEELISESRWAPTDDNGQGGNGQVGDVDLTTLPPPGTAAIDEAEADLASSLGDDGAGRAGAITMPRGPLVIGIGVAVVGLIALFAFLWSGGGDDAETETADPEESTDATGSPDPSDDADAVDPEPAPPSSDPEDQERIDELSQQLEDLEAELENQPVPALPGDALERVVVATDAKFVSAIGTSVAVVDPHGGLALINPENNVVVATGQVSTTGATRVLRTESAAWITNYTGNELLRVDPVTNTVVTRFPVAGPDGIIADAGTLLVASYDSGTLVRLDPGSGAPTQTAEIGGNPTAVVNGGPDVGLWVAVFDTGEVVQVDPATFEVVRRVTVGAGPVGLTVANGAVWVANHEEGTVVSVDPTTGEVILTIEVGDGPTELIEAWGSLWVTVTDAHDLVQLDPATGEILTRTPLGGSGINGGPTGISATDTALWIGVLGERSVVRVDQSAVG